MNNFFFHTFILLLKKALLLWRVPIVLDLFPCFYGVQLQLLAQPRVAVLLWSFCRCDLIFLDCGFFQNSWKELILGASFLPQKANLLRSLFTCLSPPFFSDFCQGTVSPFLINIVYSFCALSSCRIIFSYNKAFFKLTYFFLSSTSFHLFLFLP